MIPDKPALLLDVMSTLVHDPFFEEMPAFFGMTFDAMWAQKSKAHWVPFERGELDSDTYLARFFADGRAFDHAAFLANLRDAYRFLPGIEALLQELRGTVELHAFSNYPSWYALIEERLTLSRYLKWSFVSCNTGLRKPDPAAYESAARALSREPADCVFVDDREENCQAARRVGMTAFRFVGAKTLRADLASVGLLD